MEGENCEFLSRIARVLTDVDDGFESSSDQVDWWLWSYLDLPAFMLVFLLGIQAAR